MCLDLLELPLEIHYKVVECLENDVGALKVCSMLNKAWLPIARSFMFREVTLASWEISLRFCELIRGNPDIAILVRTMKIGPRGMIYGQKGEVSRLHAFVPVDLSRKLHNTLELCIDGFHVWSTDEYVTLKTMSSVRELSLKNCSFTPEELHNIINSFPHLHTLKMSQCFHWSSDTAENNNNVEFMTLRLRRLYFSCIAPPFNAAITFVQNVASSKNSELLGDVHVTIGSWSLHIKDDVALRLVEFLGDIGSLKNHSDRRLL